MNKNTEGPKFEVESNTLQDLEIFELTGFREKET